LPVEDSNDDDDDDDEDDDDAGGSCEDCYNTDGDNSMQTHFQLNIQTENKLRRSIQNDMLWNYMLQHILVLHCIVSEIMSAYGIPVHCMKHPL